MTTPTLDPAVSGLALDILNHAAERDEWDLQPGLALVTKTDPPHPVRFPIPDELWQDAHPVDVLHFMASAISGGTATVLSNKPFDLAGILFVTEMFDLRKEDMTPQQLEEFDEWVKTNNLQDHPSGAARESRAIYAIDRKRVLGRLIHLRGEPPATEVAYGGSGRLPDVLLRFMEALEGAWKL